MESVAPALFEESFSKRTIEVHLVKEHVISKDVVRGWHAHMDAMASQNQHLANWSHFQLAWERMHASAPPNLALADGPAPPPPVLGANVPPPGDGEDSGAAANDAARFYPTPRRARATANSRIIH